MSTDWSWKIFCLFFLAFPLATSAANTELDSYNVLNEETDPNLQFGLYNGFNFSYYAYTSIGWNFTNISVNILEENLDKIENIPRSPGSRSGDFITVFPEFAFTTLRVLTDRNLARRLAQRVPLPDYNFIPCANSTQDLVVRRMSCFSLNRTMYTVVGILEKEPCAANLKGCREDGLKIYSTTVVFAKNGTIMARYRKSNLIDEPALDKSSSTLQVTFKTESNITFGLLTGHDLLFRNPARHMIAKNVTNFIFNGAWKNLMPFKFSVGYEAGWAATNNVSLIAAGYLRVELGYSGIGHYEKNYYRAKVPRLSGNYYSFDSSLSDNAAEINSTHKAHLSRSQNLTEWSSVQVPFRTESSQVKVCHPKNDSEFCCTLDYTLAKNVSNLNYKLIAFDGYRTDAKGKVLQAEQTCGVTACSGDNITTCGADKSDVMFTKETAFKTFNLTGSFDAKNVVPVTMRGDDEYLPIQNITYTIDKNGTRYDARIDAYAPIVVHSVGLSLTDHKFMSSARSIYSSSLLTIILVFVSKNLI